MKSFIKNLTLATVASSLFLAYAPIAQEKKAHVIHLSKSQVITENAGEGKHEIKKIIMLNGEELSHNDGATLDEKLADLDPEIREKVLSALGDVNVESLSNGDGTAVKGVVTILKRDEETGEIVDISSEGSDIDLSVLNLDEIIGSNVDLKTAVFKIAGNQTDAMIQMLKRGEFTQHELDRIQVALDSKR